MPRTLRLVGVGTVAGLFSGFFGVGAYGNLRLGPGLVVGALAIAGSLAGAAIANVVPERNLELGFAGLLMFTAYQVVREDPDEGDSDDGDDDG